MNVNPIIEWAGVLLIFGGSLMSLISAFGLLRLPDVYTRSHAATKSSTLAVLLSLFGAFLYFWAHNGYISVRLILGIVFVFLTAPVAGHLITRAAYRSGVELSESSDDDELEEILFPEGRDKGN
ncbi:Na+/H+ antiporter subunit G [Viridibacillus sp. NPDC096237]|uniref:Na+/H+ antiporter subunit G n=1 Tax=Viridibacillus sp. NPDC096237 TaxID=3390721 RepID=UPI003D065D6E